MTEERRRQHRRLNSILSHSWHTTTTFSLFSSLTRLRSETCSISSHHPTYSGALCPDILKMISENLDTSSLNGMNLETECASTSFTAERFSTAIIKNNNGNDKKHFETMKNLLRMTRIGIDDPIRKTLWMDLTFAFNSPSHFADDDFETQFETLTVNKLPRFVDAANARFFALNSKARRHVSTILWNLSQSYPQVTFAPLLYPVVSLFLHYHHPNDVYRCMVALMSSNKIRYISMSKLDKSRDAFILVKLTSKFGFFRRRKFAQIRHQLHQNLIEAAYNEWVQWIFASLPFHHCVRIIDCYLVEGEKFLFRVALELAYLFDKNLQYPLTLEKMREFSENINEFITPSQLIMNAFKLSRFSRRDIHKIRDNVEKRSGSLSFSESPLLSRSDILSDKDFVFASRIAPRKFKSSILSWNQLDVLWEWIPERVYVLEPFVVFCSDEDGNSLQTFYSHCGEHEPIIILIKTLNNEVFGAYCSAAFSRRFENSNKSGQYFGNGETFLFSISPVAIKYDWAGKQRDPNTLSTSQQLFMSASNNSFSIGAGGSIGLFVDDLARGETNRCETFENEPLTSSKMTMFDISVVEVIAFS